MSQRVEKVAQRIKKEVSAILHDEIKDPRIGFLTITRVQLTPDLRFARIFYSVMGSDDQKKKAKEGIESASKYIRKLLGERLVLRYTPDFCFKVDESIEYSIHIDEIFEKIHREREKKEGDTDDTQSDS